MGRVDEDPVAAGCSADTEAGSRLAAEQAAQITGRGLGGLLAQLLGPPTALLADAVGYAASAWCLLRIRTTARERLIIKGSGLAVAGSGRGFVGWAGRVEQEPERAFGDAGLDGRGVGGGGVAWRNFWDATRESSHQDAPSASRSRRSSPPARPRAMWVDASAPMVEQARRGRESVNCAFRELRLPTGQGRGTGPSRRVAHPDFYYSL